MAPGADEFDAILEFDARWLAAMAMPAYVHCAYLCRARCACSTAHTALLYLTARTRAPQALRGAGATIHMFFTTQGSVQVRRIPPPAPKIRMRVPIANSSGHTHIYRLRQLPTLTGRMGAPRSSTLFGYGKRSFFLRVHAPQVPRGQLRYFGGLVEPPMLFCLRLWDGAQHGHVAAASAPPAAGDDVGASLDMLAVPPPRC